jgi:tRNA nucleotidyltransferase/poly(A) polymerase
MAMDDKGKIIDPYHGQDDLKNGILTIILPRIATQEANVKEIPIN